MVLYKPKWGSQPQKRSSWMNAQSVPAQRFLAAAHKVRRELDSLPKQTRKALQEWCAASEMTGSVNQGKGGEEDDLSWTLSLDLTEACPIRFSWRYFVIPFFDGVLFDEDRGYYTHVYHADLEDMRKALRVRPNAVNDKIVSVFFKAAVPAMDDLLLQLNERIRAAGLSQKPARAKKARV